MSAVFANALHVLYVAQTAPSAPAGTGGGAGGTGGSGAAVDPLGGLLSYGVLGVVVVCLITGLLVPGYLYKRTEGENDRLRRLIDDKVYPAVEASTNATREALRAVSASDTTSQRVNDTLNDVISTLSALEANLMDAAPPRPRPRPRKKAGE